MIISSWSSDVCSSDLDQGIVADPDIILNYQLIIIKNILVHNTELFLIKGGMRRQCVGGVINGCGPNAVGNGAIAPDLDGPRHPPLIEAAIGIDRKSTRLNSSH